MPGKAYLHSGVHRDCGEAISRRDNGVVRETSVGARRALRRCSAMAFDLIARKPDSAIATYTSCTKSIMGKMNNVGTPRAVVPSPRRTLGGATKRRGGGERKFVDLEERGSGTKPKVADAKARLAKLTGVEGKVVVCVLSLQCGALKSCPGVFSPGSVKPRYAVHNCRNR